MSFTNIARSSTLPWSTLTSKRWDILVPISWHFNCPDALVPGWTTQLAETWFSTTPNSRLNLAPPGFSGSSQTRVPYQKVLPCVHSGAFQFNLGHSSLCPHPSRKLINILEEPPQVQGTVVVARCSTVSSSSCPSGGTSSSYSPTVPFFLPSCCSQTSSGTDQTTP